MFDYHGPMTGGTGDDQVDAVLGAVRSLCSSLEPVTVPLADVPRLFDTLAAMAKLVDGALTRLTPRYEMAMAGAPGVKDPAEATSRSTGASRGGARRRRERAEAAKSQPALDAALRNGRLSSEQADSIADAAELPTDEVERLVEHASTSSVKDLRDEVARSRAAFEDESRRAARIHSARRLRRWTASDGTFHLHLSGPAAWGAEIGAALQPEVDRRWEAARASGHQEPREAYEADALVEAVCGRGRESGSRRQAVRPDRKVIALVDVAALERGHAEPGERCEIPGVGPVSVPLIRSMLSDAQLALVFAKGRDIRNVTHLGRQVTAHQRTALEARGYRCANPACDSTHRLEIDHVTGWSLTRTTTLDDLDWLCHRCHGRKTYEGWMLTGPPGQRAFGPPPDPIPSSRPPNPQATLLGV